MYKANIVIDRYQGYLSDSVLTFPEGCPVEINVSYVDEGNVIDVPNMTLDIKYPNGEVVQISNNTKVVFGVQGTYYLEIDTQIDETKRLVTGKARIFISQTISGCAKRNIV